MRILFSIYFIFEIVSVFAYISNYGFLNYVGEAFLSFVVGIFVMGLAGFNNYSNISSISSFKNIFGSIGIVIGSLALMVPGILSDIFGSMLIIISFLLKILGFYSSQNEPNFSNKKSYKSDNEDVVIDVEVIDESKK